jgi:hypothetical protein
VAEPVSGQPVEQAGGPAVEPVAEQAAGLAVEQVAEQAVERVADRAAEQTVEEVADQPADRAAEQGPHCFEAGSRTSPGCDLRQPRVIMNLFRRVSFMVSKGMLRLIAAGGLSLATFGQTAPRMAPIPSDPLELVSGPIQAVDTSESRADILLLLARARDSYSLRNAGRAYDLKVTFTTNSGGQTEYDGAWKMEDVFDPQQGLRWTAKAGGGFTTTRISSKTVFYEDGTARTVPLRLHEARAALFDPIPSSENVARGLIRTSTAVLHGAKVTCVLLSASGSAATATPGRGWEESEECIDPQSGLLQVQSQVPGRYYAYDYSNAPQLGDCVLPRTVIVTEAGKTVSKISVDSLTELPAADAGLFVPTEVMKARGPASGMAGAQKIVRFYGRGPFPSGATVRPVCVFGLVTPSGQLVEAHSLQPSDPNSQAAVEAAKRMSFFAPTPPGARHRQHFVFVIEMFVSSQ